MCFYLFLSVFDGFSFSSIGETENTNKKDISEHFNSLVIPDKQLKECIRHTVNSLVGSKGNPIKSLFDLKKLVCTKRDIKSLDGLENFLSLTYLNLNNNSISDISVVESLTNLKHFDISDNNVSNYQSLKYHKSLNYIDLKYNKIKDLSIFQTIPTLVTLKLPNMETIYCADIKNFSDNRANDELIIGGESRCKGGGYFLFHYGTRSKSALTFKTNELFFYDKVPKNEIEAELQALENKLNTMKNSYNDKYKMADAKYE